MKKLIIVVTLLGIAAAQVKAQDVAGQSGQAGAADAVYARVVDAEAMSWAWRIERAKDMSYQNLVKVSANWGRGEAVRGQLLAKVKEIVNKGQLRRLTTREDSELDAAKAEARSILSGSRARSERSSGRRAPRQSAIDGTAREILEVEAKYWAWRIAVVRNITYNELKGHSEGWMRGVEVSDELLAKIRIKLQSGENQGLSGDEQAKFDAGNKKIKQLLSRA
ncbi:MAG: hypothetical protein PHV36_08700 [Elusimicrobiales bacterium]|nr:hypothetical protein [Elusimicrobiales bacterium]